MQESGDFATIGDLATQERMAPSYLTQVMRVTLLAPEIVEGIVEGRGHGMELTELLGPFPVKWKRQLQQPATTVHDGERNTTELARPYLRHQRHHEHTSACRLTTPPTVLMITWHKHSKVISRWKFHHDLAEGWGI